LTYFFKNYNINHILNIGGKREFAHVKCTIEKGQGRKGEVESRGIPDTGTYPQEIENVCFQEWDYLERVDDRGH
jgi:hypothetical protein